MDLESLWGMVTIVGPLLLVAAIAWAMLRNRTSRRQEAETEAATARLYDAQSREDDGRDAASAQGGSDGR